MFVTIPCRCPGRHRTDDQACPSSATHILRFDNGRQLVMCEGCADYWELDHGHQITSHRPIREGNPASYEVPYYD